MLAKIWPSKESSDASDKGESSGPKRKPMPKADFIRLIVAEAKRGNGQGSQIAQEERATLDAVTFFVKTMNDQEGLTLHLHEFDYSYTEKRAKTTVTISMDGVQDKMKKRVLHFLLEGDNIFVQLEEKPDSFKRQPYLSGAASKHFYNFSDAQGREDFLRTIASELSGFNWKQRYSSRRVGYVYSRLAKHNKP